MTKKEFLKLRSDLENLTEGHVDPLEVVYALVQHTVYVAYTCAPSVETADAVLRGAMEHAIDQYEEEE